MARQKVPCPNKGCSSAAHFSDSKAFVECFVKVPSDPECSQALDRSPFPTQRDIRIRELSKIKFNRDRALEPKDHKGHSAGTHAVELIFQKVPNSDEAIQSYFESLTPDDEYEIQKIITHTRDKIHQGRYKTPICSAANEQYFKKKVASSFPENLYSFLMSRHYAQGMVENLPVVRDSPKSQTKSYIPSILEFIEDDLRNHRVDFDKHLRNSQKIEFRPSNTNEGWGAFPKKEWGIFHICPWNGWKVEMLLNNLDFSRSNLLSLETSIDNHFDEITKLVTSVSDQNISLTKDQTVYRGSHNFARGFQGVVSSAYQNVTEPIHSHPNASDIQKTITLLNH